MDLTQFRKIITAYSERHVEPLHTSVRKVNYLNVKADKTVMYKVVSKIFETDAAKIAELTIKSLGHRHPRSSSLPHVDTGPTVFSIFGTLPGIPFLSERQALSAIRPISPQWYQTGVLSASISFLKIGRSQRVPNPRITVGGE
jgi:hypothetical protein